MPAIHLNKNGYFIILLISLVLLILWNSRTDLPPKKADIGGKDKKAGFDMGGLGGGGGGAKSDSESPLPPTPPEPPQAPQPPVPPQRPAWMDEAPERSQQHPEPPTEEPPPEGRSAPQESPQFPEVIALATTSTTPSYEAATTSSTVPYVYTSTSANEHSAATSSVSTHATGFPNPEFDVHNLKRYKPHNYRGPGHQTYATYLSTRGGSVRDPYFLAAQQLVYRILWDPKSKSVNHPITVFVAPHIPDEQRDILTAAGAVVRELDYVEGHTGESDATKWKDLFSKLNMWAQTDYSRITFLDLDAFPVKNIDGVFDVAQKRQCQRELLAPEEQSNAQHICEFVFTGTDASGANEVNAGVMVFEPNAAMHQYLLRESKKTDNFDSSLAEQPFLNFAFRQNGPFPTEFVDRSWNGIRPQESEKDMLKVMHAKLWEIDPQANGALSWAGDIFSQNWQEMLTLYQSPNFESMRAADGTRAYR